MDICEPENRPGVDEADFRSALGRFASGVTVVTSLVGNTSPIGATVTAFSSVSLDPPLVLFCLTSESATFTAIKETGKCAINILAEDQEHLSRAFSQRLVDWNSVNATPGENKVPLLDGTVATIEAEIQDIHPGGDHSIFVALVTRVETTDREPLLHHRGAYAAVSRHRA